MKTLVLGVLGLVISVSAVAGQVTIACQNGQTVHVAAPANNMGVADTGSKQITLQQYQDGSPLHVSTYTGFTSNETVNYNYKAVMFSCE